MIPLLHKKGLVSDARVRSLPVFPAGGPLGDSREDELALIVAARDATAAGGGRALAVISPEDYRADLDGFVADSLPPRWVVECRRPRRAAGRMAQDLEQPLPQPEEGRQGGVHLPRRDRARVT